jgi:hypothetical protein
MKLKHRILSCLTLLAVVWGIVFSSVVFFQQQEENSKTLVHSSSIAETSNHSIDSDLALIYLLSNKTEENREITEYEKEANEEDYLYVVIDYLLADFRLFNLYFHHTLSELIFTPKCSIIIKYCSLKLPF